MEYYTFILLRAKKKQTGKYTRGTRGTRKMDGELLTTKKKGVGDYFFGA